MPDVGAAADREIATACVIDAPPAPFAEICLVEPPVGLLGEHAREALAVEIQPAVRPAVHAIGRLSAASTSSSRTASWTCGREYSSWSGGSDFFR